MRYVFLALALLLLMQRAANSADGSLSQEGTNLLIRQKGIYARSVMTVNDSIPKGATITSVNWRYELSASPPSGFKSALCTQSACIHLDGGSGRSQGLKGKAVVSPFYLQFYVPGKGALRPPINVLHYQIIINYQR